MAQALEATQTDTLDLSHLSATICAELAAGLSDAAGVRDKYKISQRQWDRLKVSPVFRGMLREALQEWTGDINVGKRIIKKAEILLEDALPVLHKIIHDEEAPRQNRLDGVKQVRDIARPPGKEGAAGLMNAAQINIIIDTGEKNKPVETVTIDAKVLTEPVDEVT